LFEECSPDDPDMFAEVRHPISKPSGSKEIKYRTLYIRKAPEFDKKIAHLKAFASHPVK
jgi:hypothetical protein